MFKKLTGACVGLAIMGLAGTANAALFTYQYVGENFTDLFGGAYSMEDSVSGQFTVDLGSNTSLIFDDYSDNITNFSFFDGVQTVSFGDPIVDFDFSTDGVGDLVLWSIIIEDAGVGIRTTNSPSTSGVSDQGLVSGSFGNNFDSPGAWALVPLPAALPLMGTGLAVLGFLGWRRRKAA